MAKEKESLTTRIRGEKIAPKTEGAFKELLSEKTAVGTSPANTDESDMYPHSALDEYSRQSTEKHTDYLRLTGVLDTAFERMDKVVEVLDETASGLKKEIKARKENYNYLKDEIDDLKDDIGDIESALEKITVFLEKIYGLKMYKDIDFFKKKVKKIKKKEE